MVDPPFFAPQNQPPVRRRGRRGSAGFKLRSRRSWPASASCRRRPAKTSFILDHIARRSAVEVVDGESGKGWALSFDPHFWEKFIRVDPMSLITAARSPLALIRGAKSQLFHPEDAAYLLSFIAPGSP